MPRAHPGRGRPPARHRHRRPGRAAPRHRPLAGRSGKGLPRRARRSRAWRRRARLGACRASGSPASAARARSKSSMQRPHPFRSVVYAHDATIACIGAHGARDGGIVIVGTGSVGFAVVGGREVRVGGYGFPISDEGSGADLGLHAIRLALRAYDERAVDSNLTRDVMTRFHNDPFEAVAWMDPRDGHRLCDLRAAGDAPCRRRRSGGAADRPRRRRADRRTGAPARRMRRVPHRAARRARLVDAAVARARRPAPAGPGRGRCGGRRLASRPARRTKS